MPPPKNPNTVWHYVHLNILVLFWGVTAIIGKLITAPTTTVVLYRTLLAAIAMGGIIALRKRSLFPSTQRDFWEMIGVGIIVGLHWLAFFGAVKISSASVALAGFSTCSLWTAFLEPLFTKKRIKVLEIGMALLIMLGLYLIFLFEVQSSWGLILGLVSGLLGALMGIFNGFLTHRNDASVMTLWEMTAATFITAILILVFWKLDIELPQLSISWYNWLWIAVLAWGCTIYPFTVANQLLRRFSAFTLGLALNLEPVYGIILAYFIFGKSEQMTMGFYAGAALILIVVLLYPWLNSRVGQSGREEDYSTQ